MLTEQETSIGNFDFTIEEQGIRLIFLSSKRKKTKKINVVIEGTFTLNNAALVHEKISGVINAFDATSIALKDIQQIDLAAIQLLYYLKKIAAVNGKFVTLEADLSHEDRSVLFNSGLMGLLTKTKLTD